MLKGRCFPVKKKCMMALVLLVLALLTSAALAESHPCDRCGGPTTCVGTGAWCSWYCETCDYTTSRNHNPNSALSGLVPDSCSGHCAWCGAAADASSHTFVNYEYNKDATCTENGTETAHCANVQCGATDTRPSENTTLGHDYKTTVVAPTCTKEGISENVCQRCGDTRYFNLVAPLGHSFEAGTSNPDGTHTIACGREGCKATITEACSLRETVVGGVKISYCPVCNRMISHGSTATPVIISGLTVLVDAVPLDVELELDVMPLYMIIISRATPLEEMTELIIDLKEYPFEVAEGPYASLLPEQLDAEQLTLYYVGTDHTADLAAETWYATNFTLEDGVLTFRTTDLGVFLLIPVQPAA